MTRQGERWIWIGVVVLLLAIGAVVFAGPAGQMLRHCAEMMGQTPANEVATVTRLTDVGPRTTL